MSEKFWMVYGGIGTAPVKKHDSLVDAKAEAGRLARKHVGEDFYVLEAVECASAEVPVSWSKPTEVLF